MDSSDYCDNPPVDSDDDNNDRDKQDSSRATSFLMENTMKTLVEKCGLNVLWCKMRTPSDCAKDETASYVCNLWEYFLLCNK